MRLRLNARFKTLRSLQPVRLAVSGHFLAFGGELGLALIAGLLLSRSDLPASAVVPRWVGLAGAVFLVLLARRPAALLLTKFMPAGLSAPRARPVPGEPVEGWGAPAASEAVLPGLEIRDAARWRDILREQECAEEFATQQGLAAARLGLFERMMSVQGREDRHRVQLPSFCEFTNEQLLKVIEETASAAYVIMDRLCKMESLIGAFAGFVRTAEAEAAVLRHSAGESISRNSGLLSRLDAYQDKRGVAAAAAYDKTVQIVKDSKTIDQSVAIIEKIVLTTEILALNASIEAARAGEAGSGFAVVALEVRSLARQTKAAADSIKLNLSRFQNNIGLQLQGDSGKTQREAERQLLVELTQQLTELASGSGDLRVCQERILAEMDGLTGEIACAVTLAVGEIQFQDVTQQRLEGIMRGMVALKAGDADAAFDIMKAQNTVGDRQVTMEMF